MDHAAINDITDLQTLRKMLAVQAQVIADHEQRIVQHEQTIAEHDQCIAMHQQAMAERNQRIVHHEQVISSHEQVIARHERTIIKREARISVLTDEIARLRRLQFAARSEKMDPDQRALFEETMAADIAAVEAELDALQSSTTTKRERTDKPMRRPLPDHLERIETRHEPASCQCGACGEHLVHIGDHVSEKLSCKPLQFFVRKDIYPQYACRAVIPPLLTLAKSGAKRPRPISAWV